jgi:hypothetical protein
MELPTWAISVMAVVVMGLQGTYRPIPWRYRLALALPLVMLSGTYLAIPWLSAADARLVSRLSIFVLLTALSVVLTILQFSRRQHG